MLINIYTGKNDKVCDDESVDGLSRLGTDGNIIRYT